MPAKGSKIPIEWAAIAGRWDFEGSMATYLGPDPRSPFPHGIALSSLHLRNGAVNTHVEYPEDPAAHEGRIIFGYSPTTRSYYLAGMGGYGYTYVIDEFLLTCPPITDPGCKLGSVRKGGRAHAQKAIFLRANHPEAEGGGSAAQSGSNGTTSL